MVESRVAWDGTRVTITLCSFMEEEEWAPSASLLRLEQLVQLEIATLPRDTFDIKVFQCNKEHLKTQVKKQYTAEVCHRQQPQIIRSSRRLGEPAASNKKRQQQY